VELVVTEVEGGIDGLEGLEVDVDLALLAFGGEDFTTIDDKAVGRDLRVQLQALLGGRDGRQDGQTVDARLDVGGSTLAGLLVYYVHVVRAGSWDIRILQPTSSPRATPGPWAG
jgi:hypothetical protein